MKSEELRHLTASEPLTLEQEYAMQGSWREDEDSEEPPPPQSPRQPPLSCPFSPLSYCPSRGVTKLWLKSLEVAYARTT